jgi:hypothetical protein
MSAPFRAQPPRAGIRPVPRDRRREWPTHRRESRCLSAIGLRFLGILFPPRSSAPLTIGLPDQPQRSGPDGVSTFHTYETRPGWAPSIPRDQRCPHNRFVITGCRSSSPPTTRSSTRGIHPAPRVNRHEASQRVHSRSPVRPSPRPVVPPGGAGALGLLPRASHP